MTLVRLVRRDIGLLECPKEGHKNDPRHGTSLL